MCDHHHTPSQVADEVDHTALSDEEVRAIVDEIGTLTKKLQDGGFASILIDGLYNAEGAHFHSAVRVPRDTTAGSVARIYSDFHSELARHWRSMAYGEGRENMDDADDDVEPETESAPTDASATDAPVEAQAPVGAEA